MASHSIKKTFQINNVQTPSQYELAQKKRLRQAAKMYESQFLNTMVAQMRKTVPESGLVKKSYAEKFFQNKLDQNYVEAWTNKGGIGLADLVYNQIEQKLFGKHQYMPRPKGPIDIDSQKKPLELQKK